MAKKRFQDLNLNNAFLFAAALEDSVTCRMILETALGQPVPEVDVHPEHSLLLNSDYRSARLDVYAVDGLHVTYNLEMQNEKNRNLPQRSRYHQALLDATSLLPGEDFGYLQPVYTIFICTFDPFGRKYYRYTFENICLEGGFPLEDGAKKIFLCTKGTNDKDVPKELIGFLHYVENSTDEYVQKVQEDRIDKLHSRVSALKKSREWRNRYMLLGEWMDEQVRLEVKEQVEKRVQAQVEKQEQILKLVRLMIQDGAADQLLRLESDKDFLEEMLLKYQVLSV